ncbi:dihydroorotase [Chitinilyticum piscinae]|uniref:Dihydroorotase n=1 Tax=Chitinilyticum piscinae TaxID=2866724 RepID=A0A8J7FVK3_9NEIS|nr:dihydroorotase [Chitinilyticum piscinae]MBE9607955.1 dihydroorotase [Chitinilyticum piscinae]
MQTLTLTRPDDWHLHVRDGEFLQSVVPHTAREFGRAIIMPNLRPPVTTVEQAAAYRERILAAVPAGLSFEPLMTLYLTDNTSPDEIVKAKESGFIHGVKLYPAGATTNSDSGVTDLDRRMAVLEKMAEVGLNFLVHGEVTDAEIDIFDREAVFIDRVMQPLLARLPELKVVFEHITTKDAADFVASAPANVAATITAHHLLYNRNAMLAGGIRPHYYCLPILKREVHRQALVRAATSGSAKFFLGTDSAPHAKGAKEASCGCAGAYTAHAALPLYAEAFESVGKLDQLEAFASLNGPAFYGLKPNADKVTLVKESWSVPEEYAFGDSVVVPLRAGSSIAWKLAD